MALLKAGEKKKFETFLSGKWQMIRQMKLSPLTNSCAVKVRERYITLGLNPIR